MQLVQKHLISQALLALSLMACSDAEKNISIDIVKGHESDAFSQDPPVVRVDIRARTAEGDVTLKASAPPGGSFDFGEVPADRLFSFDITGVDAAENIVLRGRSVGGIYLAALAGDYLPVFVQRVNTWARPPGELLHAHLGAPATTLAERYVVSSGGSQAFANTGEVLSNTSEFYDLLSYGGAEGPKLPRSAKTMVGRLAALLAIDDEGATWVDFDLGGFGNVELPLGLNSFADVAGARPIESSDGRTFIVAATRTGAAAGDAVLVVAPTGVLSAMKLSSPRSGAAALWIDEIGLVIAGGSSTAAGIEILRPTGTVFEPQAYVPDETQGAGAAFAGTTRMVLAGGTLMNAPAPTRIFDLECKSNCTANPIEMANLPLRLQDISAYALDANRSIFVGSESEGEQMTRTFMLDLLAPKATELPLREPRKGAVSTPTPLGTLAIIGGLHADGTPALTLETLFPQ